MAPAVGNESQLQLPPEGRGGVFKEGCLPQLSSRTSRHDLGEKTRKNIPEKGLISSEVWRQARTHLLGQGGQHGRHREGGIVAGRKQGWRLRWDLC